MTQDKDKNNTVAQSPPSICLKHLDFLVIVILEFAKPSNRGGCQVAYWLKGTYAHLQNRGILDIVMSERQQNLPQISAFHCSIITPKDPL